MLEGHPVMYHGACMVRLTRLPPFKAKHSSNFELLKIFFRAMQELKHKFREVFKPLKTNVSRKYFSTTLISVSPV
jgi:hypothetical protein